MPNQWMRKDVVTKKLAHEELIQLQQFQQRLTDNIQPLLIQESLMTNAFIQQLLVARHLTCELVIKKSSFKDYEHFRIFYKRLLKYEQRLNQYFKQYCLDNHLSDLARDHCIKVVGFYVSAIDFAKAEPDHNMLMIYVELATSNNKKSISSLYNWEEKFNDLRTDNYPAGLQHPIKGEDDDDSLPF